jgi:hypothetical protein
MYKLFYLVAQSCAAALQNFIVIKQMSIKVSIIFSCNGPGLLQLPDIISLVSRGWHLSAVSECLGLVVDQLSHYIIDN